MPPIPVPGAGPAPNWGDGYNSVYPMMGLSALTQGLTQGVNTGLQLRQTQMQHDQQMAYQNAMLGLRGQGLAETGRHHGEMEGILGGSPENVDELKKMLLNGGTPEQLALFSGSGIAGAVARQKAAQAALKEGYDPTKAQLGFAEQKYETTSPAQTRQRGAEEVLAMIGTMRESAKKVGLSDMPIKNKIRSIYAHQTGSPDFDELIQNSAAISEAAQGMIGQGSDAKLRLFQHQLMDPANMSAAQLESGLNVMENLARKRAKAFGSRRVAGDMPPPAAPDFTDLYKKHGLLEE